MNYRVDLDRWDDDLGQWVGTDEVRLFNRIEEAEE